MTDVSGAIQIVLVIQAIAIVALLVHQARRGQASRVMRESEDRFRRVADHAPVILWTARIDTRLDFVNAFSVEFSGIPPEQLLNEGWLRFIHPQDVEPSMGVYVPAFEARRPFMFEFRLRRADGVFRWMLASGIPKYSVDGSFDGYIGCSIDITERKEAEDRIRETSLVLEASHRQIQHLAGRLIEAQDAERARIARDLHDDLSQQLAGLGIMLSGLKRKVGNPGAEEEIDRAVTTLQERTVALAQSVRNLSHELHPSVLVHVGLVATLRRHCADVGKLYHLEVPFSAGDDLDSLTSDIALCLFRVAQEALRNAVRHAQARTIRVQLMATHDGVELCVADDGIGFVASECTGSGLGLRSIDERVRLAKGHVTVESRPGHGTNLLVRIPLAASEAELVQV